MDDLNSRRHFLAGAAKTAGAAAALGALPASIQRALAIPARRRAGTIEDVQHIVVLMLENRSFDHYFATLPGVRGFADRFVIPVSDLPDGTKRSVWQQALRGADGKTEMVQPFRLDTKLDFSVMRVTGAPHVWSNAQEAWNHGRVDAWPTYKHAHSMAHFGASDLPFQFALANAFTIADAYHCSFQGGTNPNRCYLFTGTVDGQPAGNGPAIGNLYNTFAGGQANGYQWTTYPERLEAAGISWRIYQNMEVDFFALNPLVGFKQYRDAEALMPGSNQALKQKGLATRDLPELKADVMAGTLPQVSWICPTSYGSEHPGPSSPAQGAQYTAQVLDALTANPAVWASTVLLIMFDENDGFFDHVPPPAAPSIEHWNGSLEQSRFAGASTLPIDAEYHLDKSGEADDTDAFMYRPYGLGPRVPLYAVSPWSTGGWVSSEVADHTSVIRFIERRFGVQEANISPWRRAVCGDLTGLFDFSTRKDDRIERLPKTDAEAHRARALKQTTTPKRPAAAEILRQESASRPSRALPYRFVIEERVSPEGVTLDFVNRGSAAAVIHVYDRRALDQLPRRYTVGAFAQLSDAWMFQADEAYDLWLLGPNGFHRRFEGQLGDATLDVRLVEEPALSRVRLVIENRSTAQCSISAGATPYGAPARELQVAAGGKVEWLYATGESGGWYDVDLRLVGAGPFRRRFAGRMENGRDSISDPAMNGDALIPGPITAA